MSDIRGLTGQRDSQGKPKAGATPVPVLVDPKGRLITVAWAMAQSPSGLVLTRADHDGTQYVTTGIRSIRVAVPGIGAASAYASGDAFGTKFMLHTLVDGTIATVVFRDYADQGLTKELVLFNEDFTETADNSPFAVSDADLGKCVGVVSIATFYNFGNNQIGIVMPALYYTTPGGVLFCQLVTRGADNIAQGAIPDLTVMVV